VLNLDGMLAHCPKCASQLLVPIDGVRASTGAAALQCPACSGYWVPPELLTLPSTLEILGQRDTRRRPPASEGMRTGQCPEGHGVLRRARVTLHDPYFLERCARCGGVWFDAGEWSRTVSENLLGNLSEVWSPAWRRHLSDQQSHESLEVDLKSKLGRELFDALHALAERLEGHPHRGVALAYLSERLKHPPDVDEP